MRASAPSAARPASGADDAQGARPTAGRQADGGDAAREWFKTHTSATPAHDVADAYRAPGEGAPAPAGRAWAVTGTITFRALRLAARALRGLASGVASSEASQGQGLATGAAAVFFVVLGVVLFPPARSAALGALGDAAIGIGAVLALLVVLDVLWFWVRRQMRERG